MTQDTKSKTEKPAAPRTIHDRYAAAIAIIPPAKRKSSSEDAMLEHVAHVEKMTGKKIP